MTVKFEPAAQGADKDVFENGIKLKMVITVSNNEYTDAADENAVKSIYVLSGYNTACGDVGYVELNSGNKVKGEITVNLSDYISVNAISLPTKSDYDNYKTAFDNAKITITISEVVDA